MKDREGFRTLAERREGDDMKDREGFRKLVEGFPTKRGLLELAWECWKLLDFHKRMIVASTMEFDAGPKDDERFLDEWEALL